MSNNSTVQKRLLTDETGHRIADALEIMANVRSRILTDFSTLQTVLRQGDIEEYISVGDQISVEKLASLAVSSSNSGLTVTVNADTFEEAEGEAANRQYEFEYDGIAWHTDGTIVSLATYGITVTGTPAEGDLIVVTETASELVFDVLAIDYDTPSNPNLTHSLTLGLHDIASYGAIQFSPKQAFYYAAEAIPANTVCSFSYPTGISAWGQVVAGETYYFTPTAEIPAGAQLVFSGDIYSAKPSTMNVQVFANASTTTVSATYPITASGTATKDLGALNGTDCNHYQRCAYGANRWDYSISRMWLNSKAKGAASGVASWYTPQGIYARPVSSTLDGWLHGIDPSFVKVLGAVKKRTSITPFGDAGGYQDTDETVFLQSMTEVFGSKNNSVAETSFGTDGTIKEVAYPYWAARNTNEDRIKYQGTTARNWWLRTPFPSYSNNERSVGSSGALGNYNASNSIGLVPACVIV